MRAPSLLSIDEGRRGRPERPTCEGRPARRGSGRGTYTRGDSQHGRPVGLSGRPGNGSIGSRVRQESEGFDSIPHSELLRCVARRVSDGKMLHLIKMWLKAPVEETDERGHRRMSGGKKATRGTPQGGVASPLLANIYMHRFIKAFRKYGLDRRYGAVLVTYADDFVVLCRHDAVEVLDTIDRKSVV